MSKVLADPRLPKANDDSVNPIALIRIGLLDPKDGIVAPNAPIVTPIEEKK